MFNVKTFKTHVKNFGPSAPVPGDSEDVVFRVSNCRSLQCFGPKDCRLFIKKQVLHPQNSGFSPWKCAWLKGLFWRKNAKNPPFEALSDLVNDLSWTACTSRPFTRDPPRRVAGDSTERDTACLSVEPRWRTIVSPLPSRRRFSKWSAGARAKGGGEEGSRRRSLWQGRGSTRRTMLPRRCGKGLSSRNVFGSYRSTEFPPFFHKNDVFPQNNTHM